MPSASMISAREAPCSSAALTWKPVQSSQRIATEIPIAISSLVLTSSALGVRRGLRHAGEGFHDVGGIAAQGSHESLQFFDKLRTNSSSANLHCHAYSCGQPEIFTRLYMIMAMPRH
jgi:hypothetical protein